jgi:hypothetical protein
MGQFICKGFVRLENAISISHLAQCAPGMPAVQGQRVLTRQRLRISYLY